MKPLCSLLFASLFVYLILYAFGHLLLERQQNPHMLERARE